MRVKLNIFERVLVRMSCVLSDLARNMTTYIRHKYDPEGVYNTISYNPKELKEFIFSNEEES